MSRPIDVMHLGRDRVICAYELDGLIVDPGPASSIENVLAEVPEPRGLLLTHIHLDHAGASGVLARRFPGLPIYVHERGAPHLVDPSKLLVSASRLYGDRMEELWGEVAPVPEENLRVLSGGETVEGFRVAYTPGHASHHVCFLHEATGDAYVGDMAGIRIPPSDFTVMPTPPPDIDLEAWRQSIETIASWKPAALAVTHFGRVEDDVEQHLAMAAERLAAAGELARRIDGEAFAERLRDEIAERADGLAPAYRQAARPELQFLGLERYWRKHGATA